MSKIGFLIKAPIARIVSGTVVANLINAVSMPILTFIFKPEVYAVFGLFSMFVSIGNAVATLKLGQLYMNENSLMGRATNVKTFIFVAPLMAFFISLLFGFLVFNKLFGFGGVPAYYVFLLFLALLGVGFYNYFKLLNLKSRQYAKLQVLEPIKAAVRAGGQILIGLIGFKVFALPVGETLGRYAGIYSLTKNIRKRLLIYLKVTSLARALQYLNFNRPFLIFASMSGLINVISSTIMLPAIVELYGESLAGEYSLVVKLLTIPIALVGAAVADVFHERCSNNMDKIGAIFKSYSKTLLVFSGITFTVLYFLVEPLSAIVFNDNWLRVGKIAKILIPWFFGVLAISPLSRVLLVLRKEKLKMIYDIFSLLGMIGLIFWAKAFDLTWENYLRMAAYYWVIAYALYFLLINFSVRRHFVSGN